uniref:Exported protein n=1 Tax=Parastrongyloides trichosuri TaxID=131310 RepID=A0A0N4ZMG9_PARTI
MRMAKLLINYFSIFIFLLVILRNDVFCDDKEEKKDETSKKANEALDRFAVNLAGAFVKSMFPEMERSASQKTVTSLEEGVQSRSEIRRAPQSMTNIQSDPIYQAYNNIKDQYSASPAGRAMESLNSLSGSFPTSSSHMSNIASSNGGIPAGLSPDMVASLMSPITENLSAGVGGAEAINALRRQKYLQDLQKHQSEVNNFSQQQIEYLEAQRKYQQAMVNQQAGAALLMQQQQQAFLNKMKSKYAGVPISERDENISTGEAVKSLVTDPFNENVRSSNNIEDNQTGGSIFEEAKDPVRQHAAKTAARAAFAEKHQEGGREMIANSKNLKKLFKQLYGINIPENGDISKLSEKDKSTLRELKKYIVEKGASISSNKGVYDIIKEHKKEVSSKGSTGMEEEIVDLLKTPNDEYDNDDDEKICDVCIPVQLTKIKGPWTQIFGNPSVIKKTFATVLTLMDMSSLESGVVTSNLSPRTASCIGMEIGKTSKTTGKSKINMFFRDDSSKKAIHKMNGTIIVEGNIIKSDLDIIESNYCLVKGGGLTLRNKYEYMILADASGPNKCTTFHIYTRSVEDFNNKFFDEVSDFMKDKVLMNGVRPVAPLPDAELCQLQD